MVDFTVRRDGTVESAVYDVSPLTDTANPFGDFCVVKIDDRGGDKFDKYSRGTALEVTINDDGQTFDRFDGYVVEARETEQSGADALEVEAYTFDQFLRRNTVSNDQTGNTIAEALESIVTNDTPVSYVASNIEVSDPQELTRSYRGKPVEVVLRDLAFKSGNEAFGVNDSREFFFRPRETKHIDRGIDNTQWFNYDIPELGKDAINEVEVFFNDGNESVVIDAPTDKLELQDGLSLPEPGTQREELNRPLVTDIQDAEDIGRQYLQFRNATLSGTVTTFGLYDAEPGDTINVTIESRGIDTEFRIAAVEYHWGRDETRLTIVERRGDQDKILSRISESVKRQEMETADRDAPSNRITTTEANAIIDVSVNADGNTPDDTRFVNSGRNAVRDAWAGDGNPDIDTISIGVDGTGLSRSNDSLGQVVASIGAATSFPTTTSVEFSGITTTGTIREIGLETSGGTLISRAVFPNGIEVNGEINITLDVSNDDTVQRGVLTNDGQTAVRDVLADNAPNLPTDYAYGSNGSAVSVSDTALGNELQVDDLDTLLTQSADTNDEWIDITQIQQTNPLTINNGVLKTLQSGFVFEGEDSEAAIIGQDSDSSYSDGLAEGFDGDQLSVGSRLEYSFTPEYDIESYRIDVREILEDFDGDNTVNVPEITLKINNYSEILTTDNASLSEGGPDWRSVSFTQSNAPTLTAGETVTIAFEVTKASQSQYDNWWFDVVAILDDRFSYTFNNTVDANGYLSGPELYPDSFDFQPASVDLRRDVFDGSFNSTWIDGDVSGSQQIAVSPDGSTFTTFNNTTSDSFMFSNGTRNITTRFRFSRYGSRSSATPTTGFKGQGIDFWELFVDPRAPVVDGIGRTNTRAIVPKNSGLSGDTIREAGIKSNGTLLTHHELAEFTLQQNQRLASSETTRFKGTE